MPDSFEHMPAVAIRMPNGALASLAGNIDPHHRVAIADLILVQTRVRSTIERLIRDVEPDVVGLSVMTFQRATALKIARLIHALRPSARIVVGGYDPSLATEAFEACPDVDFIVRGEGEQTLCELLRAIEDRGPARAALRSIGGLSYRDGTRFVHNAPRPVIPLASTALRLPNRDARVLRGYTLLGRTVDVVETSRGCTYDCSFCSIIEMRGRNFHPYAIDRVLADIGDARAHGAEAIFLVDDNITLDVARFEALCRAIIESGFNDAEYFVQAMTAPIAQHGARLAPLMRQAGFRYVFLGIENVLDEDLGFLRARAKNARREKGRTIGNASIEAIEHLHRHGLYVVGGLIVGNPDDTRESIEANLAFARRYVDWPYIQHRPPCPRGSARGGEPSGTTCVSSRKSSHRRRRTRRRDAFDRIAQLLAQPAVGHASDDVVDEMHGHRHVQRSAEPHHCLKRHSKDDDDRRRSPALQHVADAEGHRDERGGDHGMADQRGEQRRLDATPRDLLAEARRGRDQYP